VAENEAAWGVGCCTPFRGGSILRFAREVGSRKFRSLKDSGARSPRRSAIVGHRHRQAGLFAEQAVDVRMSEPPPA